eukprot:gene2287-2821_t
MSKLKKQDLSDEQVNQILRNSEHNKDPITNVTVNESENNVDPQRNVYKAQKKIKKMVPKDVEKFD